MLDPKHLRDTEKLDALSKKLKDRGYILDTDLIKKLETTRAELQLNTETLQNQRNTKSKEIGIAKAKSKSQEKSPEKSPGQEVDIASIQQEVVQINKNLEQEQSKLHDIQSQIKKLALEMPNIADKDVPVGENEQDNQLIRTVGEPKKFDFKPLDHVSIADNKMDFERAAKLSGSRFVVLRKNIARLHRALSQFMIDVHTNIHKYEEVYTPLLVKSDCYYGTGQLPKFQDDFFSIQDKDLHLISTAEVSLTNLYANEIIPENNLPIKLTALTSCFRSEAGSYGKDTHGMFRQHQFDKVELVKFVKPESGDQELEDLTQDAEKILQLLELPYRVMKLCTKDMGFSAAKTYDLEVWLPGQNQYREISSCSLFRDFQTRRMKIRYKDPSDKKTKLLYTLNGSGLAIGRTLIAILENHQNEDKSINIPQALQAYLNNETVLKF